MAMKWLIFKVKAINLFRNLKLIPNIWYKSELELAEIRGKEMAEFFRKSLHD